LLLFQKEALSPLPGAPISAAVRMPFLAAVLLFALSFLGIAVSLWPMIVPGHYTLWQAASAESTQAFLLIGTLALLPAILFYTARSYWIFRGKVAAQPV
jgi:cytochrome d ubiquinol oxidase subunit II